MILEKQSLKISLQSDNFSQLCSKLCEKEIVKEDLFID